jgi:hypothetical protein
MRNGTKPRRPTPALVVSIVALVVACGGSAVAASHYIITSSTQVKNGAITGADVRDGSLRGGDLADGTITGAKIKKGSVPSSALAGATAPGQTSATEAFRKTGPVLTQGGKATVATLDLKPGAYAVFAKVNLSPNQEDNGLLETALKSNKTIEGRCHLDVAGDADESAGAIVSPGSENVLFLEEQITRTIDKNGTATLTCQAFNVPWKASDASIIAIAIGDSARVASAPAP